MTDRQEPDTDADLTLAEIVRLVADYEATDTIPDASFVHRVRRIVHDRAPAAYRQMIAAEYRQPTHTGRPSTNGTHR